MLTSANTSMGTTVMPAKLPCVALPRLILNGSWAALFGILMVAMIYGLYSGVLQIQVFLKQRTEQSFD